MHFWRAFWKCCSVCLKCCTFQFNDSGKGEDISTLPAAKRTPSTSRKMTRDLDCKRLRPAQALLNDGNAKSVSRVVTCSFLWSMRHANLTVVGHLLGIQPISWRKLRLRARLFSFPCFHSRSLAPLSRGPGEV